jgi:hypothetical protein
MTPQDAVNEATELCEAIFERPEDAVALVALKLGELQGREQQESQQQVEEEYGAIVSNTQRRARLEIEKRLSAFHAVDGNVWLYGQKVWEPGLSGPSSIAYQLRCAIYAGIEGKPPLVPLDQVPPAVVIPPGDTSMISFVKE